MTDTEPEPDFRTCSVADIALRIPSAIRVLNRYGLDYSCDGKRSFVQACEKAYVDSEHVWSEICKEQAITGANTRRSFGSWETSLLIDFILQHHHEYLRITIPQIKELLNTICAAHPEDEQLESIRIHFELLAHELAEHLPREEQVLFPALRSLVKSAVHPGNESLISAIQSTIHVMEHEHNRSGELIRCIRRLSNDYTVPSHAGPTFLLLFRLLEEFEYDVMQHIHLENNILFPKVKAEQQN